MKLGVCPGLWISVLINLIYSIAVFILPFVTVGLTRAPSIDAANIALLRCLSEVGLKVTTLFDNEFFKTHYIYVFDSLSSLNDNEFFKNDNEIQTF